MRVSRDRAKQTRRGLPSGDRQDQATCRTGRKLGRSTYLSVTQQPKAALVRSETKQHLVVAVAVAVAVVGLGVQSHGLVLPVYRPLGSR